MRKIWMAVFTLFLGVTFAAAQQQAPPKQEQPPQSAAEAARKAREQKKNAAKPSRVFTNDDVQTIKGTASVVGTVAPPPDSATTETRKEGEKSPAEDEAAWRKRFADARLKVSQAEKELDILQRELNLLSQQYYSDPTKALQEQYNRKEINDQNAKLDAKKKEVQQLKQALSDLEDELRKAGKPTAWSQG